MTQERKERNRGTKVWGIGLPLIMVVFVILCLITMAVLSLLTSLRAEKIEEESFRTFQQRTVMENAAEERIAAYNRNLTLHPDTAKEEVSFTVDGSGKISDESKSPEDNSGEDAADRKLEVTLKRTKDGENAFYRVVKWKTVISHKNESQTRQGITFGKSKPE